MKKIRLMTLFAAFLLLSCSREQDAGVDAAVPATAVEPPPAAEAPGDAGTQVDPDSGLVIDRHWELVRGHCGACHSTQLVTQNRGSRQTWLEMIRWMQDSQGLWPLDPVTETAILDYLEKNYPPADRYRRAPLPAELMPENPYATGD